LFRGRSLLQLGDQPVGAAVVFLRGPDRESQIHGGDRGSRSHLHPELERGGPVGRRADGVGSAFVEGDSRLGAVAQRLDGGRAALRVPPIGDAGRKDAVGRRSVVVSGRRGGGSLKCALELGIGRGVLIGACARVERRCRVGRFFLVAGRTRKRGDAAAQG